MRSKKKGFTVLELIIALSITVLVLGIVYSFFLSNTKTINEAQIQLDLQEQGENVISRISKEAMEARYITNISPVDNISVAGLTSCKVKDVVFQTISNTNEIYYNLSSGILTEHDAINTTPAQIEKDIQDITITSIDGNPLVDVGHSCRGISLSINMSKMKAGKIYTYNVSTTINFRNHN